MVSKQKIIDAVHKQLRESSAKLGEDRRHLEALRKRAVDREECKQKIANLRKASADERFQLSQLHQQYGLPRNGETARELRLGDADKGISPILPDHDKNLLQNPALLNSLPPVSALKSRVGVYVSNNANLEESIRAMRNKSKEVEGKYKRIISLCTGMEEARVEGALDGLIKAVDSEGKDVEVGRINDFLRRVDGGVD